MKFNTKILAGEWCKYNEEVEFLIRPFPNSKQPFKMSGEITIGEYNWILFCECVLDWRGVEDSDGNPIKCNAENKLKIFDLNIDFLNFIVEKQAAIKNQQEAEVKN